MDKIENLKGIFVMLAKLMSKEQCIERLQEALNEYQQALLTGDDETLRRTEANIELSCHLLLMNGVEGNPKDIIEQMDEVKRSVDFFKTDKN